MSELMLDVGSANELKMAFRRAGFTPEDVKKLGEGDFAATILPVLRGTAVVQIVKHIVNLSGNCMPEVWKKDKWKIEKHVGSGMLELDPSNLRLYFSPNQLDGNAVVGNNLRADLEDSKVPVLNACVLDHLLAHPELIPKDWKVDENGNTRQIYFWGTIYRRLDGSLFVRCLYWHDGAWRWRCSWLGHERDDQDPAAVLASVT
ncbi:hypothetical protein HYV69_04055 [Candidatus Uhrbacteria bacterium]|nr:hypothetical protein [Candidatus Uhrbacteria bacterium]